MTGRKILYCSVTWGEGKSCISHSIHLLQTDVNASDDLCLRLELKRTLPNHNDPCHAYQNATHKSVQAPVESNCIFLAIFYQLLPHKEQ
jgi:hypothetical protein